MITNISESTSKTTEYSDIKSKYELQFVKYDHLFRKQTEGSDRTTNPWVEAICLLKQKFNIY